MRPVLERRFPDLEHAAALIGHGSEVLGFDDDMSRDHQWGPRVQLFVRDPAPLGDVTETLAAELPTTIAGFPTHFGPTDEPGTVAMVELQAGPVDHRVELLHLREYLIVELGIDASQGLDVADWLVTPAQRLLELTSGDVFVDPVGEVTRVREQLAWYPHDVWLLVMAGVWRRIAQLEHFLGRTGARGDELGSRLIAAALVRDLMRLALLQEQRYPPYWKWLGRAYAELERPELNALARVLAADEWTAREDALVDAFEAVARRHNELGLGEVVEPTVRPFWGRPFRVLSADRFADALRAAIKDPAVRAVEHNAGSIDAVSDNVDVLSEASLFCELRVMYDA